MAARKALILDSRAVLRAAGPDVRPFLQGLISNDIEKVTASHSIWAAFLTPQGKFLHEFFIGLDPSDHDALLIDCEAARRDDLRRRLSLYKLRSKVTIADASDEYSVAALFGDDTAAALKLPTKPGATAAFAGGIAFIDPRLAELDARAILPRQDAEAALCDAGFAPAALADYDRLRVALGVPDGSRDLEIERSPLLENGFDELHGVDWDKGCFMGQELTARTKYRALIKKRLMPVEIDGPMPAPETPVTRDGKEVGTMRSSAADAGLALLRLDALEGELRAGEAKLSPRKPSWARY
jgi:folate-binding protein YgfZ